jgi:hypothetical protein
MSLKYAYNEVLRLTKILDPADMNDVKQWWDNEVTRWWPSGVESREPDWPHETYFTREIPLYIDFSDFDQKWLAPEVDTGKYVFEESAGPSGISQTREALNRLHRTSEAGLYRPECLSILNETFNKHYINEKTGRNEIARLAENVAERIEAEPGIARETFWQSTLNEWPLYHFVSKRI